MASIPTDAAARRAAGPAADAAPAPEAEVVCGALLDWYASRERDIPWRSERDPYRVWVAEIMAQQTRVETMRPYYARFTERFPTLERLAAADLDEVLKRWEGLGYYARARNLHAGARVVMERFGGRMPGDAETLRELPGVGAYTAGAVASIAFGADEPAVDGNARRVLSRLFDLAEPRPAELDDVARSLIATRPGRAGALNQALMDLGSELCTPRSPACEVCPVDSHCRARARGTSPLRPAARRNGRGEGGAGLPHRRRAVAIVRREGRVLVVRRPEQGLLGGLWDFPGLAPEPLEPTGPARLRTRLVEALTAEWGVGVEPGARVARHDHTFSHFRLTTFAYAAGWRSGCVRPRPGWRVRWIPPEELDTLAFPTALRPFLRAV